MTSDASPIPKSDGLSGFEIGREIGSGSTGTVYLATVKRAIRGLKAGETVAVKFLHERLLDDPVARRRFVREARAGLAVKHPNLVRVYAVDETELLGSRVLFLLMELVEGPTLRDLLAEGPLAEPLVRSVGAQVARGLAALHATGVVHLDVKPENVVLATGGRAVLMDLGFARALAASSESERDELSTFAGSVAYAAPERLRGQPPLPQSDVYALGVLLFELATNERPFPGNDLAAVIRGHLEGVPPHPSAKNPRVSPLLDAVVAKCLEKDPSHRFESAAELANVLERAEASTFWREKLAERATSATPGLRRSHLTSFHGRENELRELDSELARVAAGAFRVVEIRGETGLGKTRLVDEFVVMALQSEDPPLSLYGRSPRVGDPPPAEPFLAMLERYLGIPRGKDPDASAARRLRALVPASTSTAILDYLRAPDSSTPLASFARALAIFLEAACAEQPAVAFLDDIDQADPATVIVVNAILSLAPPRLLLVLARRPEASRIDTAIAFARERGVLTLIALEPLAAHAIGEIVDDLVEPGEQRVALRDALVRGTGGNAGHIAEAIRTLRASGVLVPGSGRLRLTSSPDAIPIPASVSAAIRQRLAVLSPDERRAAERVAVAGDRCDVDLLVSAYGGDRIGWLRTLSNLENRHALLTSSAGTFRFARPIVREVLYDSIDPTERSALHGALAAALDARLPAKASDRERLRVAEHARRSPDRALALKHLPGLAETFRRRGLFERGLQLARAAIDILNTLPRTRRDLLEMRFDLLSTAAECTSRLGRRVEERRTLEKCALIARYLNDPARIARTSLSLGRFAHATGRYLVAGSYLDRAIALANSSGDARTEAEASLAKATVLSYAGDAESAGQLIERALALATEGDLRARALLQQGLRWLNLDRPDLAIDVIDAAYLSFRELRMPAAQASAHFHRARAPSDLGMLAAARKDLDRAIALAAESGDRRTEATALSLSGSLRASTGEFDRAEKELRAALAIAREIHDRFTECHTALHLANALVSRRNPRRNLREGLRLARLGLSIAEELELTRLRALAHAVRARAHLRAGRIADALSESQRALQVLTEGPSDRRREVAVLFTRGLVLHEAGRAAESREFLERAASILRDRAERIPVDNLRRSFLEDEPFHRKVIGAASSARAADSTPHSTSASSDTSTQNAPNASPSPP